MSRAETVGEVPSREVTEGIVLLVGDLFVGILDGDLLPASVVHECGVIRGGGVVVRLLDHLSRPSEEVSDVARLADEG